MAAIIQGLSLRRLRWCSSAAPPQSDVRFLSSPALELDDRDQSLRSLANDLQLGADVLIEGKDNPANMRDVLHAYCEPSLRSLRYLGPLLAEDLIPGRRDELGLCRGAFADLPEQRVHQRVFHG